MDTIQCAVVLGKLERFAWEVGRRRMLGQRYWELLASSGARVGFIAVRPDRDCVWAQYTLFVDARSDLQARIQNLGVPTAVHYPKPLHHQPAYAGQCVSSDCPNSVVASQRVMSLPIYPDMTNEQQDFVVASLLV
jgi:UDP-2-acetamido-2-deoxy-ribo-hexuluronate aminotransferase